MKNWISPRDSQPQCPLPTLPAPTTTQCLKFRDEWPKTQKNVLHWWAQKGLNQMQDNKLGINSRPLPMIVFPGDNESHTRWRRGLTEQLACAMENGPGCLGMQNASLYITYQDPGTSPGPERRWAMATHDTGGCWLLCGLWIKGAGRREVVGAGTDTGCAHSKRGGSCCLPSSLSRGTH